MSIEQLEKIKQDFTIKYNVIRTKDFLVEINEGYGLIRQFMKYSIDTLKHQQDQITELKGKVKKLEQEGSYFDRVENIKEIQNLSGEIHLKVR